MRICRDGDQNRRVFYAVLNMGLGHATRSLPIIREFINRGWEVLLGSSGRALAFLRRELPGVSAVTTPDYGIEYSRGNCLFPKIMLQLPGVFRKILEERQCLMRLVADFSPALIISDHCYGMYHSTIPCYFLSHQVYFAMPAGLNILSPLAARFNFFFHRKFNGVIIPDLPGKRGGLLAGELSRIPQRQRFYHYGGLLSSIGRSGSIEQIDLLVSISGPEPQRTLFEEVVLGQIERLPGKKVVVLGKSESLTKLKEVAGLEIYSHLSRSRMNELLNQAGLIVSRPGYSTLMELAELGKKALLIPTPGQTEQQYLARRLTTHHWFYSVSQGKLDLRRDIPIAKTFTGISCPGATRQAVKRIFDDIWGL